MVRRMRTRFLLVATLLVYAAPAQAQDHPAPVDTLLFEGLAFRHVGPARGGRVTAVAGHAAHPGTFYFGATGGGVWKSRDYGQTWRPISDGFFETASIGAIRVAPSDTNIVYVGTGSEALRSNVILGRGLYKSADAGRTWTHMGLREAGQIGSVEVHPTNPDVVYAAALGNPFKPNLERGVYRSQNGGASWTQVLFVSDSTGAVDLELNPANPDELYAALWRAERKPWTIISGDAAESGIYKSTDAGTTWTRLEGGLPSTLVGKIDLAVSPADPNRLYALVEAPDEEEGLYRSDDRGATFELVSDTAGLMSRPFYYTNVDADPSNADVVYVNNLALWKSTDGGGTFARIDTPHGDNHDIWINPDDPRLMVQANDGGANVSRDGGRTWTTQHNQPTAELYQLHVDDRFPYWLYAGQQDNTTIAVPSLPPAESAVGGLESYWKAVGGCETGPAVPKPGDPDVVYSNCKGRFGRFNQRTGQEQQYYVGAQNMYGRNPAALTYRFQRVVPIEVSPHNPNVLYHGSQFVHRTLDEGKTWETISPDLTAQPPGTQVVSGGPITRDITGEEHYSTLYVIQAAPLEEGVLWVGANDGPVHLTRDGGTTWTDVTPPDWPPMGRVQHIEPSPHAPGTAYMAGYRTLLGDFTPYLFKTEDYGQTWTRRTHGIPADFPVRVVREDPDRPGLLYAGTDFGLFISFDDGAHWQPFQRNLPVTPVTDIQVHRQDLVLSTMGRGFWILDNLTPLHQLHPEQTAAPLHLFQPRNAYRMRYRVFQRHPGDPSYPPPGALIDFFVPEVPDGPVTLEILDADGRQVRHFTYTGADAPEAEAPEAPFMHTRESKVGPVPQEGLDLTAGLNRFRWDLRYPGTWQPEQTERGDGPLAPPGTYQVRLTVADTTVAQPLNLRIDPRVAADGVTHEDLHAQWDLNMRIRDAISAARQLAEDVKAVHTARAENNQDVTALDRLHAALVNAEGGSYPAPMLISQLQYLYGMTTRADQRPGRDAYARYETLKAELEMLQKDFAPLN